MSNSPFVPQPKQFWKDYYACQKPRCLGCQRQGISENEYNFCSLEKKPATIYDEWGRKVVHVFNEIYACNVYHWVIYQGNPHKVKQGLANKKASVNKADSSQ